MSILVTTDFSDNSAAAIRVAARRARARDVPLTVLYCVEAAADEQKWYAENPEDTPEEYGRGAMEELETFVDDTLSAEERPETLHTEIELAHAVEGITDAIEEGDFDLVVTGATGRNRIANFFLGSTPEEIARRSEIPLLVVPANNEPRSSDRIVAPVDFSACSRQSLARAADLAREEDAKLIVIHALFAPGSESSPIPTLAPLEAQEALEREHAKRFNALIEETDLEGLDWEKRTVMDLPHQAIIDTVENAKADLVVMGTHGRRGLEKLFLGSTATKVLRRMPCSIMTVRAQKKD